LPDRPPEIIEISESLGRDVDRWREGNGPAPPMEAFMSDESLEQVDRQTRAAGAPVHAEDLVPISAAEAATRTTFDGETLPRLPTTRRVIPAPFRRPSINITHHGRQWMPCRAELVEVGDTVPDVGRVVHRELVNRYETIAGVPDVAVGVKVILTGAGGIRRAFDPQEQIRAHRHPE
jgi:hypothetical protein